MWGYSLRAANVGSRKMVLERKWNLTFCRRQAWGGRGSREGAYFQGKMLLGVKFSGERREVRRFLRGFLRLMVSTFQATRPAFRVPCWGSLAGSPGAGEMRGKDMGAGQGGQASQGLKEGVQAALLGAW